MVKIKETEYIRPDGSIDLETWLQEIAEKRRTGSIKLIGQACMLAQLTGTDTFIYPEHSCLQQGLKMAEILLDLKSDQETIAAAILYYPLLHTDLSLDDISEHMGENIARLIAGAQQIEAVHSLQLSTEKPLEQHHAQIDNLRKMLLAMVEDVRVVLLKLAERTCLMRLAARLPETQRKEIAIETRNIYAPLANRLGIGQLKWELEDLCFRYLEPTLYKNLAKQLDERRIDRENYIKEIMDILKTLLTNAHINEIEITGRAKHIFSIYKKMQRKEVDYNQIYDASAVRILVPTIEDCYTALSCVHKNWDHIPNEFDDYIAHPKPNGYRSLHTAIVGPNKKNLEVQIRTHAMHQESELGVAAHWKYKEGGGARSDYEEKIAWLRQLIEWQQELTEDDTSARNTQGIFDDRIYVFTPAGEIMDLPQGATPLDFAYYIHSEVGHRCRGALVNDNMVPLTHTLKTGERVKILTHKQPHPSRDWLNPHTGYLKTSRAKSKVHHWFKEQDYDRYLEEGQEILTQELKRNNLSASRADYQKVAEKLNLKNTNDLFVAIGHGDLKMGQVIHTLQPIITPAERLAEQRDSIIQRITTPTKHKPRDDISIHGVDDLLTYNAKCCKPLPGDLIVGFITKGRGVSIHRQHCTNITNTPHKERLIDVSWTNAKTHLYPIELFIVADSKLSIKDLLSVLTHENTQLLNLKTTTQNTDDTKYIVIMVEIDELGSLQRLIDHIKQVPDVLEVNREFGQQVG